MRAHPLHVRITLGLRSPVAFQLWGHKTQDWLEAAPDTVGIEFEGRIFVWHPPMERGDGLSRIEYGPMVAVVVEDDADGREAAVALQRFLSAVAFHYDQPVDDGGGGLGGDGESDAFHPFGHRQQRAYLGEGLVRIEDELTVSDLDSSKRPTEPGTRQGCVLVLELPVACDTNGVRHPIHHRPSSATPLDQQRSLARPSFSLERHAPSETGSNRGARLRQYPAMALGRDASTMPVVEPFPDLAALSDDALRQLLRDLQAQERVVSYDRKMLQGRIDILKAQLALRGGAAREWDEPRS